MMGNDCVGPKESNRTNMRNNNGGPTGGKGHKKGGYSNTTYNGHNMQPTG